MKNPLLRACLSALLLLPLTLFVLQGFFELPSATSFGPYQVTQTTVTYTTTSYTTTTLTLPSTSTTTTVTVPVVVTSTVVVPETTVTLDTTTTTTVTPPAQPYAAEITGMTTVPNPYVGQGSPMIFTMTVRNTGANALLAARVQMKIYMPSGSLTASPYVSISNFIAGTERKVQITYMVPSSAPLGAWTYDVYVYRVYPTSTLLNQVIGQSFTVQPPIIAGTIVSVSDSPDPVARGRTATFAVTIKNTGNNMVWPLAKITIRLYTPDGKPYTMVSLTVSNVLPGQYTYKVSWAVSYYAPRGNYSYDVYLYYGTTTLVGSDVADPSNIIQVI